MDNNLKKEERQIIAMIIGFIAVIIFGLMAMFISQFGGLEALTPVHFAIGFIKAGIVFSIFFFVFGLYGNGRKRNVPYLRGPHSAGAGHRRCRKSN